MRADLKRPFAVALGCIVLAGAGFAGTIFISLSPLKAAGHGDLAEHVIAISVQPKSVLPDQFTATDKRKIEDAVRAELRAIVAQDAKRAFAKLTPSTQSFFGKPEKFLQAVADELPPILVAKKFSFLGIDRADTTTSEVLITDILGQEWLAQFGVERQESGDWRVKGCVVQANPGQRA
jgi:Domain of unknown function (DUF4864)